MMCRFGSSNHILSLLNSLIHFGNLIQYSECISLVPRTYNPIKNGPWELVCDAEKGFVTPVTITLPSGMTGVSCTPASPPFGYSCTFAAGYHGDMYESSNTVVINTTSLQDVNGTWSCGHNSETATYDLNPIINIPELKFGISPESFPTNVSRSTPSFGLSVTYGCISVPVTFEWLAVSVESNAEVNLQISSTISVNSTLCSVPDVYGYTTAIDTSDIFNVASGLSGFYSLKLEVHYTSGITALNSKEYPFLFLFSLKSATPSNEMTVEIGSSFLEVTGTIGISDVIPSFESTVLLFKPTSINTNALSLEDSNSKNVISIVPISTIESPEPTELPNSDYMKSEMGVSSTLFSLGTLNFSDETFISRTFNSDISISITTNLPISSASDLERNTEISMQDDSTQSQDNFSTISGIYIDTQTEVTSFLNSVLIFTKTTNVQTDLSPSTFTANHNSRSINTLSLQTSSDIFNVSLNNQDASADTFSLRIVTSPAGSDLSFETYSNNQIKTSVEPRSESQTEFGLTSTFDVFTSYDDSASVFQIASSSGGTSEILPISTTSFGQNNASGGSFSHVETLSISLFSYFSSLSQGTEQPDSTPFVSSKSPFISTPLLTSAPVFLDTSSFDQFAPSSGLPFGTSSVSVNFATERMSTTTYKLSPLSPSSTLQVSSLTGVSTFSELLLSNSNHRVTSEMNSVEPYDTGHVFSSPPTTKAPVLSFLEAQIIIVSCSIAVVIIIVFVPLMVLYSLGKLSRSKKPEKDSLSSVNVPHVFNFDFVQDNPNMAKTLPVRYHSRVLLDLPYSRNFENNWNSLNS